MAQGIPRDGNFKRKGVEAGESYTQYDVAGLCSGQGEQGADHTKTSTKLGTPGKALNRRHIKIWSLGPWREDRAEA